MRVLQQGPLLSEKVNVAAAPGVLAAEIALPWNDRQASPFPLALNAAGAGRAQHDRREVGSRFSILTIISQIAAGPLGPVRASRRRPRSAWWRLLHNIEDVRGIGKLKRDLVVARNGLMRGKPMSDDVKQAKEWPEMWFRWIVITILSSALVAGFGIGHIILALTR